MGSISHHITPLVIHSLGGRHTYTHTRIQTFADISNSKKPGARAGLKTMKRENVRLPEQIKLHHTHDLLRTISTRTLIHTYLGNLAN